MATIHRPLYLIMADIRSDYASKGKPVYYAAEPYVDALSQCETVRDTYGYDSADTLIRYLLSNLQTWRGDVARSVKAELKAML
jgi:hypothetical protein